MPLPQNFYAFLGAGVVGVVCAATLYIVEHYQQEKRRHGMAKDLARLDTELAVLRQELNQYLALQKEKVTKNKKKRSRNDTILSTTAATEDYASACDSDDLEFYDVSDDEEQNAIVDLNPVLYEIDVGLDEGAEKEIEQCLERLNILRIEHPNKPEILWRIAKGHYKLLQKKSTDKDFVLANVTQGLEACEIGLTLKPELWEIHKWTAILIGERIEYSGAKEKIQEGMRFKQHVERALELNPSDAVLYHMLGRFLFEFAKLKWYEKKVAALMGEIPQATYEDALDLFHKAEEYSEKEWQENKLYLGKCYMAMGNTEAALKWLESANNVKTDNGLDEKVDKEVKDLLQKVRS